MRHSTTNVPSVPIRVVALTVAACVASPASAATGAGRTEPAAGDVRADSVAALHREGEVMYAAQDYAGARNAWVDAYERIESTPETWPYRATLLSLVVTAALAEFAGNGRNDRIAEVVSLVEAARATPDLDPEVAGLLDQEWARLEPHIPPEEPDPVPVPVPVPEPDPEPEPEPEPPLPAPVLVEPPPEPEPAPPPRGGPPAAWIGGGAVVMAGGIAAIIVGTQFEPRAIDLVTGTNDSTSMPPGSTFIERERDKGRGWIIGGSVATALGTAALVTGIVLLVRRRR